MKDLALFIRKNFVQFIVAVVVVATAGILLSNAYVNQAYNIAPNYEEDCDRESFYIMLTKMNGADVITVENECNGETIIIDEYPLSFMNYNEMWYLTEESPLFNSAAHAITWYYNTMDSIQRTRYPQLFR